MSDSNETKIYVLDSHVHLFGTTHLDNLSWMTPNNKLSRNFRLDEYVANNKRKGLEIKGLVFVETDVKTDPSDLKSGYDQGVEEYLWVERIIDANLKEGEGDNKTAAENDLISAIIPWAPVCNGGIELQRYVDLLRTSSVHNTAFNRIKGFRYLLQDKPPNTMLQPDFIDGLNWLGSHNYVFDLGIDLRSGGLWQFQEFVKLIKKTKDVTYIVNHLTKPDLHLNPEEFGNSDTVSQWKELITEVANDKNNQYYIKLSGGFAELPPCISDDIERCAEYVAPWFGFLLQQFGKDHVIWGSDWPVCTVNGGEGAWSKWAQITERLLTKFDLDSTEIMYTNALKAYSI